MDGDGLDLRGDRLARIEVMRSDPGHAADQEHRHQRDRPDEHFNTAGIDKVRPVACAPVRRTKPKCDSQRREDHRDHDRQHDAERVEQDLPFGDGDGSLRIEDAFAAAAERGGADQEATSKMYRMLGPARAGPERTARRLKLARWKSRLRWLNSRSGAHGERRLLIDRRRWPATRQTTGTGRKWRMRISDALRAD